MSRRARWIGAFFVLAVTLGCPHVNWNFRAVEEGAFYRSAQMSRGLLKVVLRKYEIATVINLRGANPDQAWYRHEIRVCERQGVVQHDLAWSMNRLPSPESLQEYVTLVQTAAKPILVHCEGGTHRAGVASACYLLLQGADVEEARGQFGLFFNDAPIGEVLDLYEGSPLPFDEWVRTEYPQTRGCNPLS